MDARKSPRTKTSFLVTLTAKASGTDQSKIIRDISQSGFFVSSLGNPKIDDEYRVSIKKPGEPSAHQLTARVSRIDEDGCGLSFDGLRQHECLFLSELTNPRWDGKDLLEGVIIHGVLENTTEFASCMRLTSLLSGGYLRASRANQQTRQEPSGR